MEANLRIGKVRLLFVADALPRELKRLIEFLNEQFTNVRVLGVELRQYVGQDVKRAGAACNWTIGSRARAEGAILSLAIRSAISST